MCIGIRAGHQKQTFLSIRNSPTRYGAYMSTETTSTDDKEVYTAALCPYRSDAMNHSIADVPRGDLRRFFKQKPDSQLRASGSAPAHGAAAYAVARPAVHAQQRRLALRSSLRAFARRPRCLALLGHVRPARTSPGKSRTLAACSGGARVLRRCYPDAERPTMGPGEVAAAQSCEACRCGTARHGHLRRLRRCHHDRHLPLGRPGHLKRSPRTC